MYKLVNQFIHVAFTWLLGNAGNGEKEVPVVVLCSFPSLPSAFLPPFPSPLCPFPVLWPLHQIFLEDVGVLLACFPYGPGEPGQQWFLMHSWLKIMFPRDSTIAEEFR